MHDFRTGALEAIFLCVVTLAIFCLFWLAAFAAAALVRRLLPKTPEDDDPGPASLPYPRPAPAAVCADCANLKHRVCGDEVIPSLLLEFRPMPKCPKCGQTMLGGAPHGPWPVQYECRSCGTIVVPTSAPPRAK